MEDMFKIEGNVLVKYCRNPKITHVTIPNGVTNIGEFAFSHCNNLTSITMPNSVTSIGCGAFCGCKNLTSVVIPDSVISIGIRAFEGCIKLTNITIPNSVIKIGYWAFYNCSSLTSIIIPDGVKSIACGVFGGCRKLTNIVISGNIISIGGFAFISCENLINIVVPDSVTSIGEYTFAGCKNLISKKAHYKAFNITEQGIMCRDYIFEPNKWTKDVQNPIICEKGYHFCDNLFKIFNYYYGEIDKDIAIYECEIGDIVFSDEINEKYVTNRIKPVRRLDRKNIIDILNNIQEEEGYVYNRSKS